MSGAPLTMLALSILSTVFAANVGDIFQITLRTCHIIGKMHRYHRDAFSRWLTQAGQFSVGTVHHFFSVPPGEHAHENKFPLEVRE